jgi:hypothetical protein
MFFLKSRRIDKMIFLYVILFIAGFIIIKSNNQTCNGVLLIPVFAYICMFIIQSSNITEHEFYLYSVSIALFLLLFSLLELSVKVRLVQIPWMYDYIVNNGSKRIDVLRSHGPFGSPLSLGAITVYLTFYSLYIKKSNIIFCISALLIILSGSRTAMLLGFILFSATISIKYISIKKIVYGLSVLLFLSLLMFRFADEFGLNTVIDRVFSIESYNIASDDSFKGRSNTTIRTMMLIGKQMPNTIFYPLNNEYISDSAIVSMLAGSGFFLVVNFFIILFNKIHMITTGIKIKALLFLCIVVLALMVGDAFVPAASFYLFTIIYLTNEHPSYNNRLRRRWRRTGCVGLVHAI